MSPRPSIDHIRRPQILAAAAEVIAERGVAATRIADVAERSGVSPPAGAGQIWLWTGIAAAAFLALWLTGRTLTGRRRD